MVFDHLYIIGVAVLEAEHDAPSTRDPDGVGSLAVHCQAVDPVAGFAQISRGRDAVQMFQYIGDFRSQSRRESTSVATGEPLGGAAAKGADARRPMFLIGRE